MSNTFAQVERGLRELGDNGARFEFECYDMAHLYNLAHFLDRGSVKPSAPAGARRASSPRPSRRR